MMEKIKKESFCKMELEKLSKEELVEKIIKLEAHNSQLLNILTKDKKESKNNKSREFDFTKTHFRHILLKFYYLGWNYQGFVVQEDTINTIEHYLFLALRKTCLIKDRQTSNYHRCGRTDKGVSSFGQVISIDVRSKFPKEEQSNLANINNEISYCNVLNRVLPKEIQCIAWCPVNDNFSARFDCKYRTYKYFFPKAGLDIQAMQVAASYLVGTHDFRNLCKMDVANGVLSYVREIKSTHIDKMECLSTDNSSYEMYEFTITGTAFIWHQIRCIMAVLFLVGLKKENPDIVKKLLDIETMSRKPQYNMASEIPLNLFYCHYEEYDDWIIDKQALGKTLLSLQDKWIEHSVKTAMISRMMIELNQYSDSTLININSLIPGLLAKDYQPLVERQTCESLEDRIKHARKKLKTKEKSEDNLS